MQRILFRSYVLATSYRAAPNRFDPSKDRKRKRNMYEWKKGEENDDDDFTTTNELGVDESFTTDEQFELQIVLGDRWRVVKRLKLKSPSVS